MMEVDLTEDEVVPRKENEPIKAPDISKAKEENKTKMSTTSSAVVETVEIDDDDDDDIICEAVLPKAENSKSVSGSKSDLDSSVKGKATDTKSPDPNSVVPMIVEDDVSHKMQPIPGRAKVENKADCDTNKPDASVLSKESQEVDTKQNDPGNIQHIKSTDGCNEGGDYKKKLEKDSEKTFEGSKLRSILDKENKTEAEKTAGASKLNSENKSEANKTAGGSNLNNERKSEADKVIDISDDEDQTNIARKNRNQDRPDNKCINFHCKCGRDLARATPFILSHYGMKVIKNKRQEVCSDCFEKALIHYQNLSGMVTLHQSLFHYDQFPVRNDTVLLDSDEEGSDPDDALSLPVLKCLDENLEQVIKNSVEKYDLDYQLKEANDVINEKLASMELEQKSGDSQLNQIQKEIDAMRASFYRDHNPVIKKVPSVEIISTLPLPVNQYPGAKGKIQQIQMPTAAQMQLQQQLQQHHFQQHQQFIDQHQLQQQQQHQLSEQQYQLASPVRGQSVGVATKKVTQISPQLEAPSQDVVALEQIQLAQSPVPPIGTLHRPKPKRNDLVFVMKLSFFGIWARGRVIDVVTESNGQPLKDTLYKVRMEMSLNRKQFSVKTVPGKQIAYPNPAPVRLPVGTRVIAVFQEDETNRHGTNKGGSFYSGLIAEPPKPNNRFRYLVFFDDGYAQYVTHDKILVVCECSRNVWEDIHPDSREFIRQYLEQYPERPMVKLAKNQVVKTEWNGKWWIARVVEVDGSLVKMSFDADKRTEWIYRGSTRLAPLFSELANAKARSTVPGSISRMRGMGIPRKMNVPYVEYTQTGADDEISEIPSTTQPSAPPVRAVAKKSTSKKIEIRPPLQIPLYRPQAAMEVGVVKEVQLPSSVPMPKRFVPHQCGPSCIEWTQYSPKQMKGHNPLSIPLYCGWQRELPKFRTKRVVMYTAPCGRRLRSMEDLHRYLRLCKSSMTVDLFDFDFWVNALSEFKLIDRIRPHIQKDDISYGKENVRIPLVNYVDQSLPGSLYYSTERLPKEGVPLNLDSEFLCGCDCTDDCQNKEKCACWQLTIQGTSLCNGDPDPTVGYHYRRLQERVITGIYECNKQCKCSSTCLNRVVQHPLQLRLQLFKTEDKGWGIRCLNDIPKGTFICIYAGYLYTEQQANTEGNLHGDEYLAELDYIEVVERMKEDYESDVEDDLMDEAEETEESTKDENYNEGSDEENERRKSSRSRSKGTNEDASIYFKVSAQPSPNDESIRSRLRKRTADDIDGGDGKEKGDKKKEISRRISGEGEGSDDDDGESTVRQPSSFTAKPMEIKADLPVHRFQSVRKFFGAKENVYIMDANALGNIGRYLNHSCSPNVFVQNVFVDTHDLRFPWVAFFALTYIKAGKELTWDYNYDVGSVPNKTILCRCGSLECRGRLL